MNTIGDDQGNLESPHGKALKVGDRYLCTAIQGLGEKPGPHEGHTAEVVAVKIFVRGDDGRPTPNAIGVRCSCGGSWTFSEDEWA